MDDAKLAALTEGIEIPFPQRTVWIRGEQRADPVLNDVIAKAGSESDKLQTSEGFGTDPDGFNDVDESGADPDADDDDGDET